MSRQMFDSVTAQRLPANAILVGAYTDGHYANLAAVKAQCPHAKIVTITVQGHPGSNVADCETGDLTPEQAALWAANEIKAGRLPTIYMNLSTWPVVQQHVQAHGITGKVSYFVAHYDNVANIPAGAVAKQYIERTDQNLDYSLALDYWPGVDVHTPPPPAPATRPKNPYIMPVTVIQQGMTGPGVEFVQFALHITVDGDFGPDTERNVRAFQQHHGLVIDGVAGPATCRALAQFGW